MTRSSSDVSMIGIDGRSLSGGHSGVATYVSNLIGNLPYLDPLRVSSPRNNFIWNQLRVPLAFRSRGWAAYHAPAYTGPILDCRPLILSVHDVSYLANPDWYPYHIDSLRLRYYTASLRHADRVIVPSDFSKAEILRYFPEIKARIRRVYLGVSQQDFFPDSTAAEEVRQKLSLPGRFLLHVGDIHKRRNVPMAVEVSKQVGMPLVLVGKTLPGGEEFENWPLRFSGLSAAQLRGLYSAADALVYPSVYEGFGLPALEAMASGLPVIAANATSLPEVCGEAAILVKPDVQSLCEGVRLALDEPEKYRRAGLARAKAFSWKRTARETEEVYREVVPKLRRAEYAVSSL